MKQNNIKFHRHYEALSTGHASFFQRKLKLATATNLVLRAFLRRGEDGGVLLGGEKPWERGWIATLGNLLWRKTRMYLMGTGGVVTVKIPCAFSRIEKRGLGNGKERRAEHCTIKHITGRPLLSLYMI